MPAEVKKGNEGGFKQKETKVTKVFISTWTERAFVEEIGLAPAFRREATKEISQARSAWTWAP
jgi:hypothetical protein